MTFIERLKATYLEADGSFAIPEISATGVAVALVSSAFRDLCDWSQPFPYVAVGAGISSVVVAFGIAERVKKGVWKQNGDPSA